MARILIVDDEKRVCRVLTVLFRERGHRVETAPTGAEGLEAQLRFKPQLALVDLSLPDINGLEVLGRLRQQDPRLDVIMMTAYGTVSPAIEAMRAGAFHYLAKPFDNDEVVLLAEQAVRTRRLDDEVEALRDELVVRYGFREVVGTSPGMQSLFRATALMAKIDAPALISGEPGTGKELLARTAHRKSDRAGGPFIAVDCSQLSPGALEAQLLGRKEVARIQRPGKIEEAQGGTLFLDAVDALSLPLQARLLGVIQEAHLVRSGVERPRKVNIRLIAATCRDLEAAIEQGLFRPDLYSRLNLLRAEVPPLRERLEDLPLLIDHLLQRLGRELGPRVRAVDADAAGLLADYAWPGNVRELEDTLWRAMERCEGEMIRPQHLPPRLGGSPLSSDEVSLAEAVGAHERRLIEERLRRFGGDRAAAAKSLGISRRTLGVKMRRYDAAPR
jgi:two-component system response regulator AtoC